MTQKSKAVAKSNRAEMMERENHQLKQRVLELEERLLQAEMERAVGTMGAAGGGRMLQRSMGATGMGMGSITEEDALLGNTGGVRSINAAVDGCDCSLAGLQRLPGQACRRSPNRFLLMLFCSVLAVTRMPACFSLLCYGMTMPVAARNFVCTRS